MGLSTVPLAFVANARQIPLKLLHTYYSNKFSGFNILYELDIIRNSSTIGLVAICVAQIYCNFLMTRSYSKPFGLLMYSVLNSAVNRSFQTTLLILLRLLLDRDTANETAELCQ